MVATKGGTTGPNINNKLGLFSEMGYITIQEPYVSAGARSFHESAGKGRQMLTTGNKSKCGLTSGYFSTEFKRIFEKESYTDMAKKRREDRLLSKKKNVGTRPFLPSNYTKKPSGIGSYYGTIVGVGKVDYFSGKSREGVKREREPRNILTNPPKKGSGFGYVNVTIGKYAEHLAEKPQKAKEAEAAARKAAQDGMMGGPFKLNMHPKATFTDNPFKSDKPLPPVKRPGRTTPPIKQPFVPSSPPKKMGNSNAGTFNKHPTHSVDGYMVKAKKPTTNTYGVFVPPTIPKTRPTHSLLNRNVTKQVNVQNYTRAQKVF